MHLAFRRLLILSTFLVLGLLETFQFAMVSEHATYQVIHQQVGWWITLQLVQIVLFCLFALLVFRLVAERHGTAAMLSRMGLILFLLCVLTYTGVIGIGTGLLVAHADALTLATRVCLGPQSSIVEAISMYSGNPIGPGLLVLGGLGWIVGGVLNLVSGLMSVGLIATILGVIGLLTQSAAIAGYGWIIIRSPLQLQDLPELTMDQHA